MSAAAVTAGDIVISGVEPGHIRSIVSAYKEMGCHVTESKNELRIVSDGKLRRLNTVRSTVYPGFPTDAGPLLAAALIKAEGTSVFIENIFENRFNYAGELRRLGADIKVFGKVAIIEGKKTLFGSRLKCTDLRGGAACVIAALSAESYSIITDIHHIERGYDSLERVLSGLNAQIVKEG